METILPYALSLVLLPFSLFLISLIRKNGSKDTQNHPPGSNGWPLLGENIKLSLLGPKKFITNRMEKYSEEVFCTSLFGEKMAVFCGPQGNKFLFANENKLVTSWWPQSVKKVLGVPAQTSRHDIFKLDALKRYMPVADALAREHMHKYWSTANRTVKVLPLTRHYTFELACRLYLNVSNPIEIKKLFDAFTLANNGVISVPINLPGTSYYRGIKGGKKMREELTRIIKDRRKEVVAMQNMEMSGSDDLLSKMVVEGVQSDEDICSYMVGLLLAGNDSTSSNITSIINYLAQLPHIYEAVYKEQMEIAKSKGPNELLTWEDIGKMKYSWNVACESLRLAPPSTGTFRETTTEFTYAGFSIPKGWKTFWTVYSSHMNPKYFPEPEKFDPSRFEGSGPVPFTFVPFGGGPRMCAGRELARLQVLVYMHNVVTRFKLVKAIPDEKVVIRVSPTPVHGLPVHLYPHEKNDN